ncbi:MAG: hypothetical protein ACTHOU_06150 [Aureliella sp.]
MSDADEQSLEESNNERANRCVCPVCGGQTIEIRGKAQCLRCRTICETCCEGGRQ